MEKFGETAKGLARNPLGIIALFIVLVYAMATTVVTLGNLSGTERMPIIYFLVVFPVVVLAVFAWLVSRHSRNLYAPSDFKDESNYLASIRVAATLATASAPPGQDGKSQAATVDAVVRTVEQLQYRQIPRGRDQKKCVLWVDDRPENNSSLRDVFLSVGIEVSIALSTDQALEALNRQNYSAIISDMGRKEGSSEGYVLLDRLRKAGDGTPFFIFAGSASMEHRRRATALGAQGSTNDATELFEAVTRAVLTGPS